jgi:hypothetical protein
MQDTNKITQPQSASVAGGTAKGTVPPVAWGAGGFGIAALLGSVLQGNPDLLKIIVTGVMQWGPAVLVILIFAPQVIAAMRDQATAISELSGSIKEHLQEQHGVRIAVSMLVSRFEEFAAEMRGRK